MQIKIRYHPIRRGISYFDWPLHGGDQNVKSTSIALVKRPVARLDTQYETKNGLHPKIPGIFDAQVLRRPKMIKRRALLFCRIDKTSSENWDISFWTVLFLPWILFLTNIRYNEIKRFVHFTNSKPCCTTRPTITSIPVRIYERLGCTLNDMVYELCLG